MIPCGAGWDTVGMAKSPGSSFPTACGQSSHVLEGEKFRENSRLSLGTLLAMAL